VNYKMNFLLTPNKKTVRGDIFPDQDNFPTSKIFLLDRHFLS
jgi:hypothetical protein